MKWWNFQDTSFLIFFIIIVSVIALFVFFLISSIVSRYHGIMYKKKLNDESNTTRIFIIDLKKNTVIYFNRSDIKNKREMDLAKFYSKFHPNDIEKVQSWIFSISVDHKTASPYLEADVVINKGKRSYFSLLKLIKYDPKIGSLHLESHLLKFITPTNFASKKKKIPTGVVKRSEMDRLITHSRSLRGCTFAVRFFYIRKKVLSNDKIERYMAMTLKNIIYPFASGSKVQRQILETADNELILFDLRIASRDEAMKLALSMEHSLKKCIGVNGFSDSVNFSIGIVENAQYYQDFDMILQKARETCMNAQQHNQTIMVFQKSASQLMELDKYSDQIQDLIQKHLLRYLYRPIIDVSRKRNLGYFSYVKGYNTPFSNYTEMSKYAAMSGKTRELFATVARNILAKFDSEKPTDNARLFFHASLYDIDHMVEILPQIPALAHIRLVLVFDEQEVNENSNQLELLDSVFKKIHGMHIELALLMKDKGLLLDPHFYNNFDFFIAGAAMIGEIKKNNRIRLSIHTLIEQLLKYKRPIIATDLEGWQSIELIIKSGITMISSDTVSPSNDMLLPIEKKKMDKLITMDDSFH
jgi:hypothetical protein